MRATALVHHGFCAALIGALLLTAAPVSAKDGKNAALIGGAAAGVIGGVALGAMLNNGQAAPRPPARPVYVEDEPPPVIVRPRREPICHYERRKEWIDDQEFTYRRVEVCE